ncbi:MAG TPA: hypothetical protein VJH06_01350 [Candidatus Paceibacterota bacterium]
MSDEHESDLVHGFKINNNDHHGVEAALQKLTPEEVEHLHEAVRKHGSAERTLRIDGVDHTFKVHSAEHGHMSFHKI